MDLLTCFLPHVLAPRCFSPFRQGGDAGLGPSRRTGFDDLSRRGLPPQLSGRGEFEQPVAAPVELGLFENRTKIWRDLRPSHRFPTPESRSAP